MIVSLINFLETPTHTQCFPLKKNHGFANINKGAVKRYLVLKKEQVIFSRWHRCCFVINKTKWRVEISRKWLSAERWQIYIAWWYAWSHVEGLYLSLTLHVDRGKWSRDRLVLTEMTDFYSWLMFLVFEFYCL